MLSIFYTNDGGSLLDITPYVNLDGGNFKVTAQAEQGAVGTNTFIVDDRLGELYFTGHRRIIAIEDSAPAEHQMIFWGYLAQRSVSRLDAPVEASRQWELTVTDINILIERKVMAGNDTDRPEETDVERIQWLMTTGEAGNFDDTTTFIDTSSPVDMDAANYNGQMFKGVVDDCSQQTASKNYYARWLWDDDVSDYRAALWYGNDAVESALSDLRISNVIGDVDNDTTWYASLDSTWNPDPSRVYSGDFANYDGGYTYRVREATKDEFANRDTITSWPNVKTLAKAQARTDRELDTLHTEEEVISTTILVTPEHVNDAMAGDLISVRFTHFPGFESFRDVRILQRTVTFLTPEVYQIDYDLTPLPPVPPSFLVAFINHHTNTGSTTPPVDSSTHPWTNAGFTGNFADPSQFPGPGGDTSMAVWYRETVPGESASVLTILGGAGDISSAWVYQIAGADISTVEAVVASDSVNYVNAADIPVDSPSPAAVDSVFIASFQLQKVNYGQMTVLDNGSGTALADVNGANTATAGQGGVADPSPPTVHIGYATGTGTLTVSAVFTPYCGSGPGCYNLYGRGYGGLLFELVGPFSVIQEGFAIVAGASCVVTLPSPP